MEFTISKTALLAELVLLSDIINEGRKSVNPALSCVRITTPEILEDREQEIELVATDIDTTLRTFCAAKVTKPGAAVMDAKRLSEVVTALTTPEIAFTTEPNGWVKLNRHFKIATQPVDSFPTPPNLPDAPSYEIAGKTLSDLIARTGFAAAAKEDPRYALHAVQLVFEPGSVRMGALDGVIVAEATVKREGEDAESFLIHRRGLRALGRLATEDSMILISATPNQYFFAAGDRVLALGRLTGQFPPYQKVIPQDYTQIAAIDVTKFTELLRRVSIASPYVFAQLSDGLLRLSAESANGADEEEMSVAYDSASVSFYLRLERIEPFLKILKGETFALAAKSMNDPLLYTFRTDDLEYRLLTSPWKPNVATEEAEKQTA